MSVEDLIIRIGGESGEGIITAKKQRASQLFVDWPRGLVRDWQMWPWLR
jgi:hypothetical protein